VRNARIFLGLSTPPKGGPLDDEPTPLETPTRRVLIIEEQAPPISLVELVMLDHGHTTARTTNPFDEAAQMADLVLLDFSAPSLPRARALRRQIEASLEDGVPVVLLPAPRRVSDVAEAAQRGAPVDGAAPRR